MDETKPEKKPRAPAPKFERLMIQVTAPQLATLEEESKRLRISRSELVRRILDEWRGNLPSSSIIKDDFDNK